MNSNITSGVQSLLKVARHGAAAPPVSTGGRAAKFENHQISWPGRRAGRGGEGRGRRGGSGRLNEAEGRTICPEGGGRVGRWTPGRGSGVGRRHFTDLWASSRCCQCRATDISLLDEFRWMQTPPRCQVTLLFLYNIEAVESFGCLNSCRLPLCSKKWNIFIEMGHISS